MELKRRWDFRKVFVVAYVLLLAVYITVGLVPAKAKDYEISAEMSIPSIGLESDVATLHLNDNGLDTPDLIVGSYTRARNKTLLIGHASTVFGDLSKVKVDDTIIYDDTTFLVTDITTLAKTDVNMNYLLRAEEHSTIVLMTCAGEMFENGDASHRLIVTAVVVSE